MTPEERLRQAIEARTSRVEPSADALPVIEEKLMEARQHDTRNRLLIGLGAAAAVVAVVVGVLALTGDDDEPVVADTTTTTEGSTTSEETTTTDTTAPVFEGVDADLPVFPDPTSSQRFDDPVALTTAFARDFVGFREPIVGAFAQGDSRSGEVEVQPFEDGPITTVLVRQLEDDTWFVIGSVTDSIRIETPETGATIASPQPLVGQAYAFEGTVNVRFYVDGTQEPIAETFVTGRGDGVLGDYAGELVFTDASGATHGVLVMVALSGEDGSSTEATVIRVRL